MRIRGVITVYLSITTLLMISVLFVSLESARLYIMETAADRNADLAAEMLFSCYVRPLADRYAIFAVDTGLSGDMKVRFEDYYKMNEENEEKRLFQMYGIVQDVSMTAQQMIGDEQWTSLEKQITEVARYLLGNQSIASVRQALTAVDAAQIKYKTHTYTSKLENEGKSMDEALETVETEQTDEAWQPPASVNDPRGGISEWIKGGLMEAIMGDEKISGRTVDVSKCSWHTGENKVENAVSGFDNFTSTLSHIRNQGILQNLQSVGTHTKDQLLTDIYILKKFKALRGDNDVGDINTVLSYEIEYILNGHSTDRKNLEGTMTRLLLLRTFLNLIYLYSHQGKSASLDSLVEMLSAAAAVPIVGQVLRLLLMICWASAEAVVDCAALSEGKKVPILKSDETWQLSMSELLKLGEKGGSARAYTKDSAGLDYQQYLIVLLSMLSDEKKMVRMTQLMECNVWQEEGYAGFRLSNCMTGADFQGTVGINAYFSGFFSQMKHLFSTSYAYE